MAGTSAGLYGIVTGLFLSLGGVLAVQGDPAGGGADDGRAPDHGEVRGVTISCQTWGQEWGDPALDSELDDLVSMGVNWIAIHPYAWIRDDGTVRVWPELDPADPPEWITRPIAAAHARGMAVLIKPHLGYWGSGFSWRGAIAFDEPEARQRFFRDYRAWILALAAASRGADAFAVGTELEGTVQHEEPWRELIGAVREVFPGHLTYAANWSELELVPFWDLLDTVGVQGYFPLSEDDDPDPAALRAGWERVVRGLSAVHRRTGKPVVLTELGYSRSLLAAREPWKADVAPEPLRARAEALQVRCLGAALDALRREREWLRGAFLWKWFVGPTRARDFALKEPAVRAAVRGAWVRPPAAPPRSSAPARRRRRVRRRRG